MREEIKIVYQNYIPEELIAEFENVGIEKQLQVKIIKQQDEQKFYNFTGPEISDIVIYIKQHTTELIIGGLLAPLAYDVLKGGLKLIWAGISKLSIKRLQSKNMQEDKTKRISVRLMDRKRDIEINLDGDVNEEQANKIIDESFRFINSNRINEAFDNPDFVPDNSKPKISLVYNKENQIWEPENYGEYKRQMDESIKKERGNFSS